jgi:cation diffusion facilitator family transporter
MELYFWSFVVAILIFGLGAGLSFYEGVQRIVTPHPMTDPYVNYIVLGAAVLFEGYVWTIAFREFRRMAGRRGWLDEMRASKDPTVFTVLFEDTAAMLGLIVALAGIAASQALDMPVLDGVAAILIGVILAITASLLAYECKGLLIGEGASATVVRGIRRIVREQDGIKAINEVLTMHLGPNDVLANLSLDFADGIDADRVEASISALEQAIKAAYPEVTRIFIEAQSTAGHRRAKRKS